MLSKYEQENHYINFITFRHLGLIFSIQKSLGNCSAVSLWENFLEHLSANMLSPEDTQRVLTFIFLIKQMQMCPQHASITWKQGQRAASNHACAHVLTISRYDNLPAHRSVNVSHVISMAKNSTALIITVHSFKDDIEKTCSHSFKDCCQKSPS